MSGHLNEPEKEWKEEIGVHINLFIEELTRTIAAISSAARHRLRGYRIRSALLVLFYVRSTYGPIHSM